MIFAPFRYVLTGMIIGVVAVSLSNDYVILSRRRYNRLRRRNNNEE